MDQPKIPRVITDKSKKKRNAKGQQRIESTVVERYSQSKCNERVAV